MKTKFTKATLKSLLKTLDTKDLTVEIVGHTVLFWYDSCSEVQTDRANAAAKAVADRAGVNGWSGNGSHVRVNYVTGVIDRGDPMDPGSDHNYH